MVVLKPSPGFSPARLNGFRAHPYLFPHGESVGRFEVRGADICTRSAEGASSVYAAWQGPFAAQKFAPVERRYASARSVESRLWMRTGTMQAASRALICRLTHEPYLRIARARYSVLFGRPTHHGDSRLGKLTLPRQHLLHTFGRGRAADFEAPDDGAVA